MTGEVEDWKGRAATNPLVGELAHSVIEYLVDTPGRARLVRVEDAADALYEASLNQAGFSTGMLQAELAAHRINDPETVETCIALAARKLGDDWLTDARSFAEVAWASSRLFDYCKEIGRRWDNLQPPIASQSILVTTLDCEMHLIGPTILAQKIRRAGHSVSLMCNVAADEIEEKLSFNAFDGLMISTGSNAGLEIATETITQLRKNKALATPIVLGGAVLEFLSEGETEQMSADLATNDMDKALEFMSDSKSLLRLGAAQ